MRMVSACTPQGLSTAMIMQYGTAKDAHAFQMTHPFQPPGNQFVTANMRQDIEQKPQGHQSNCQCYDVQQMW
jgi:hypothetical protein